MRRNRLKKTFFLALIPVLALLMPHVVFGKESPADLLVNAVLSVLAPIAYFLLVFIPGWILVLITRVLVFVLSYNDFGTDTIISKGWTILRDMSNMFFIIILLVIALGTILRSSRYGYQANLRRLVLMAILINFSKTITLFFIDFSQAITISFVNAFLKSMQAGFPQMLGLTGYMSLEKTTAVGAPGVLLQIVLGGVMLIIAMLVVGVITLIFMFRIIMLAFIIILSPVAFLASTLPTSRKYYQEWWDTLGNYLVVGPVLAFFLWLSFAVVANSDSKNQGALSNQISNGTVSSAQLGSNAAGTPSLPSGDTQLQAPFNESSVNDGQVSSEPMVNSLVRFFVSICLLVGSLVTAQRLGVAGGGLAKAAQGKISGAGKAVMFGRSGAGGVMGTARSIAAIPVGFGASQLAKVDQGVSKMANRASGAIQNKITAGGTRLQGLGQAAGQLTRVAIKGGAQLGVGGLQTYTRGAEEFLRFNQAAKNKDVETKSGLSKLKTRDQLAQGLNSIDTNGQQADAAESIRRGHDIDWDEDTRRRVIGIGAGATPATKDLFDKFENSNLDIVAGGRRNEVINEHINKGEVDKLVGMQKHMTAEVIAALQEAGVKKKDMEAGHGRMTRDAQNSYDEAIRARVGDTFRQGDTTAEKDTRELGFAVDKHNAHMYATDLAASGGTLSADPDMADEEWRYKLARKIKPDKAADYSDDALKFYAPYMGKSALNGLARNGSDEQKEIIIQEVDRHYDRASNVAHDDHHVVLNVKGDPTMTTEATKFMKEASDTITHSEFFKNEAKPTPPPTTRPPITPTFSP